MPGKQQNQLNHFERYVVPLRSITREKS